MADPFTTLLTGIWSTLEAYSAGADSFTALVPSDNRIKLASATEMIGRFQPYPKSAVAPLVTVWMDAGRSQVICSSGTELATVWMFDIKMADQRPVVQAFPVMWATYRAMAAASKVGSTIRSYTFDGLGKVTDCHFTTFDAKYGLFAQDSQMQGWHTMWAYEINMVFTSSSL